MAEPKVFGFRKEPAQILKRVADREGLAPRFGSKVRYPKPLGGRGVWIGKADSPGIDSGASGTISIWDGAPGSESDTDDDLEDCFNRTGLNCDTDTWVKVTQINGHLYVEPWECPS